MRATNRTRTIGALVLAAAFIIVAPEPAFAPPAQAVIVRPQTTTTTTLVSAIVMEKWTKVAWCETHNNWQMHGATFSGALGISNIVWREYGGLEFAPHAGLATPQEQVLVATRINSNGYVPDQNGCEGSW
jgi:Transglycosylase-like domain